MWELCVEYLYVWCFTLSIIGKEQKEKKKQLIHETQGDEEPKAQNGIVPQGTSILHLLFPFYLDLTVVTASSLLYIAWKEGNIKETAGRCLQGYLSCRDIASVVGSR